MAITTLSPSAPDPAASDLVSLAEASELFRETGYEASPRTLKRWATRHGVTVVRHGRADWASWTDLIEIHARWVDEREEPGRR